MTLNGRKHDILLAEVTTLRNEMRQRRQNSDIAALRVTDDHLGTVRYCVTRFQALYEIMKTPDKDLLAWFERSKVRVKPDTLHSWLGYKNGYHPMGKSLQDALAKGTKIIYGLTDGDTPAYYLEQMLKDPKADVPAWEAYLPDGRKVERMLTKGANTYISGQVWTQAGTSEIQLGATWFKLHDAKLPSISALYRAARLFVLSQLCGRMLSSCKDMRMYELWAFNDWASTVEQHQGGQVSTDQVLAAIIKDDEFLGLVRSLPNLEPPV